MTFGALYSPAVLNARSDKALAAMVSRIQPGGPLYSYAGDSLIRIYTAGFYTGDRVRRIDVDINAGTVPRSGTLMVAERDLDGFRRYNASLAHPYRLRLLESTGRRSCDMRSPVYVFEFEQSKD